MSKLKVLLLVFVAGIGSVIPNVAVACGVCYGAPNSPMVSGMNMAIFSLLAVIAFVLGVFAISFLSLRRRAIKVRSEEVRR